MVNLFYGNSPVTDGARTFRPGAVGSLAALNTALGSLTYTPGGAVTYTIMVTNSGPSDAVGATVADTIPAGLTNVTWTSRTSGTASVTSGASGSGNNLAARVNIAAGNSIIFTVTGMVDWCLDTVNRDLVNTATVFVPSDGTIDPDTSNTGYTGSTPPPYTRFKIRGVSGADWALLVAARVPPDP